MDEDRSAGAKRFVTMATLPVVLTGSLDERPFFFQETLHRFVERGAVFRGTLLHQAPGVLEYPDPYVLRRSIFEHSIRKKCIRGMYRRYSIGEAERCVTAPRLAGPCGDSWRRPWDTSACAGVTPATSA
ncbi:hypothetical protein OVY01_05095 [Robbsia sp. Bb-Pol-6]|uniref:Uncharacterized protein n=1 Tax=Robbsia betulipollinis TaxID=2981849 RepID=A0ABT3ZJB4_9BURK|nr:hypothetical protein [Robbsia betulipollinis]MCY0386623.1 hypothetical protein [Robbsia betulipollinis]